MFESCKDRDELVWMYIGTIDSCIYCYGIKDNAKNSMLKMSAEKAMNRIVELNAEFKERLNEL